MPASTFAIFGDLHGHLRVMLCLARLWQRYNERHLDGILLAGDLGFFPNLENLDKATRRYARVDPEELGVAKYFRKPQPEVLDRKVESVLQGDLKSLETVRCPIVWCNGNHEDFDSLESLVGSQDLCSVDYYDRFLYLRNGAITEINGVRIAAAGGAPEVGNRGPDSRAYVQEKACLELRGQDFDILLGHGSPRNLGGESDYWGSDLLRELITATQPQFYFYAHHKTPIEPGLIGQSQCHWLNDVAFQFKGGEPRGPLEPGCMGILEWNGEASDFQVMKEPWSYGVTSQNWEAF